jgi:hypothetical protein
MSHSNPYISLVVAARNDNHGGNMLSRMQGMLNSWISQATAYGLSSEIVIVEWNPPEDRPRLKDALSWPEGECQVRFIEVRPDVHARLPNSASIPLHQMIAKNVGIRRARGEFILATNLDIIFSAELMQFLAERSLETGRMYRMDRADVASDTPACPTVKELLEFCESHIRRVFAREGEFALSSDGLRHLDQQDIVTPDAGIRFGSGWSQVESSGDARYRWIGEQAELFIDPSHTGERSLVLDVEAGPSAGESPVSIAIQDDAGQPLAGSALSGRSVLRLHVPESHQPAKVVLSVRGADLPLTRHPRIVNLRATRLCWESTSGSADDEPGPWRLDVSQTGPTFRWADTFEAPSPFAREIRNAAFLHTNACGDFTLLSRGDWFALRGYPEFPIWPMHIDALLCYAAHHAGIRETMLSEPLQIYHVEHSTGAGWTPEGEKARLARLAAKRVRELSYGSVTQWIDLMRRYDAPAIFTREDWGLADLNLPESTQSPA